MKFHRLNVFMLACFCFSLAALKCGNKGENLVPDKVLKQVKQHVQKVIASDYGYEVNTVKGQGKLVTIRVSTAPDEISTIQNDAFMIGRKAQEFLDTQGYADKAIIEVSVFTRDEGIEYGSVFIPPDGNSVYAKLAEVEKVRRQLLTTHTDETQEHADSGIVSSSFDNVAIITGNNVNVRNGSGTSHKVIFQLEKGDRVQILDQKTPEMEGNYYVLLTSYLYYPKGLAVKVLSSWKGKGTILNLCDGRILITEEDVTEEDAFGFGYDGELYDGVFYKVEVRPEGKKRIDTLFKCIVEEYNELHWKPVAGTPWYKIKVSDGKTGWVFGDFISKAE